MKGETEKRTWLPSIELVIAILGAVGTSLAATAALTAYAFTSFETKDHALEVTLKLERDADFRWAEAKDQLKRIEEGVRLLEQRQHDRTPTGR